MSDTSQGPGWWIASDGKWYSPEQKPGPAASEPPAAAPVEPAPVEPAPVEPAPVEPAPALPSPVAPSEVAPVTPPPVTPPPAAPETPAPAAEPPTEPIAVTPPPMTPPTGAPMTPPPMAAPPGPPPMMTPPTGGYAAAPVAEPPPEKKKTNGCLMAALIVGAIIAVLGIGLFVVLAFVVNKGVDTIKSDADAQQKVENRTGISSNPLGFNSEHPPQDDLAGDWKCSTSAGGFPQVTGTVKNNSSKSSSYTITVEFKQDGTQFTTGTGIIVSVEPGQTADFSATGSVEPSGQFTCKVDSIDRFDTSGATDN